MVEVRDLNVGDVLGLLESAQEEVYQAVRVLLKETLANVHDAWLVTGLLEYFYLSNSGRMLDILLGVSEPHDRHLLEKLAEGLKGPDRFRHTCMLLYTVRRQPLPMWTRKLINHAVMKELLHILQADQDMTVLVAAVMVIVVLLPAFPYEIGRLYLDKIQDIFCRLVRWTPKQESDKGFQPFLQVAVYSLFHRLYALYPYSLITCLRSNFAKTNSSTCFFTTLKPMMENVRLHPRLITESKESELSKNRWAGLETHQLILECAKLCLDPIEATCEEACGSFFTLNSGVDLILDPTQFPPSMLCAEENVFWSPSLAVLSPSMMTPRGSSTSTSVPQTPVFPISTPNQRLVGKVAESPPEAAVEATPETTPFTSPIKVEGSSSTSASCPKGAIRALRLNTNIGKESQANPGANVEANSSPMSPRRAQPPFAFPDNQDRSIFILAEKSSVLQHKLQQIRKERNQIQKENDQPTEIKCDGESKDLYISKAAKEIKDNTVGVERRALTERQDNNVTTTEIGASIASDSRSRQLEHYSRKRKISMYDGSKNVNLAQLLPLSNGKNHADLNDEAAESSEIDNEDNSFKLPNIIDRRISEEKESDSSDSRRSSDETKPCDARDGDESDNLGLGVPRQRSMTDLVKNIKTMTDNLGLGVPSQRSMTDLVKNIRTMRLRFLSQCGPPPDLSQYNVCGTPRAVTSPTKPLVPLTRAQYKSLSCPDLTADNTSQPFTLTEGRVRKESAVSSLTLSPIRQAVVTSEATTQTEETSVVNPYEQLLSALVSSHTTTQSVVNSEVNPNNVEESSPSPHQLLDQYIQNSIKVGNDGKNILWNSSSQSVVSHENLRNQVRLMQVVLQLERYKREVHAERNRRLLGRAKKMYALKEEQQGLEEKVLQLEEEIANFKCDLRNLQVNASAKEQQLQSNLTQQQAQASQMMMERNKALEDRNLLKQQCSALTKDNETLTTQLQAAQAALLERDRQLRVQAHLVEDNEALRNQISVLHKKVCLMGEVQDRYREEVRKLSMNGGPGAIRWAGLERVAAKRQVDEQEEQILAVVASLDAALVRVAQLELALTKKSTQLDEQQNLVKVAKEAGAEQCRAVELRCQSLASTNQTLESHMLEQNERIDRLIRQIRRSQRGKSVCSDGFDIDLELSASPSSASGSSIAISPPDDQLCQPGMFVGRQQATTLSKLDALTDLESEPDGHSRWKT